jgi:hypothetical protein
MFAHECSVFATPAHPIAQSLPALCPRSDQRSEQRLRSSCVRKSLSL